MQIEVTNLEFQDEHDRIFATVRFYDEINVPHDVAKVSVFIQTSDSVADIRERAIARAHEFLAQIESAR